MTFPARTTFMLASVALAATAQAQNSEAQNSQAQNSGPPPREATLVVYGEDPCPRSTDDEIVVCARRPEEERYRIPEALRERRDRPAEVSWGSRSEDLENSQRDSRPGSCSVVGSGGQTGCTQDLIRQWYADRRARRRQ